MSHEAGDVFVPRKDFKAAVGHGLMEKPLMGQ
jgi:hypothetical protein